MLDLSFWFIAAAVCGDYFNNKKTELGDDDGFENLL